MSQPMPTPGKVEVTPLVIADLQARSDEGLKTYGTRLMTMNGRDSLRDLYEEILDAACYAKQRLVEEGKAAVFGYEECAKIAEGARVKRPWLYGEFDWNDACDAIATAIRKEASRLISAVESEP